MADHHMTTQHVDFVINELRSRRLEHGDNPDPAIIRWAWDELPCILDETEALRATLTQAWNLERRASRFEDQRYIHLALQTRIALHDLLKQAAAGSSTPTTAP